MEAFVFLKHSHGFAYDLYKSGVSINPKSNLIVSPFAVQTSVSLMMMGATGETALQLSSAIRMEALPKYALAQYYKALNLQLSTECSGLKMSHQIFYTKKRQLKIEFLEVATDKFHVKLSGVNFTDHSRCADKINQWIEANLPRKMPGLIEGNTISPTANLILANVTYFVGIWTRSFSVNKTSKQPFWLNPAESVSVNMMNIIEQFEYIESEVLKAKVIELPFRNTEVSLLVLLPNDKCELESLESNLDKLNLDELTRRMTSEYINLSLPRFKTGGNVKLREMFSKMEIEKMFTEEAKLDAMMDDDQPIHVSEFFHRISLEINEKGTVSSAAAGMSLTRKQVVRFQTPPPEFNANHPFLYILKGPANVILYIGCVKNGKFF